MPLSYPRANLPVVAPVVPQLITWSSWKSQISAQAPSHRSLKVLCKVSNSWSYFRSQTHRVAIQTLIILPTCIGEMVVYSRKLCDFSLGSVLDVLKSIYLFLGLLYSTCFPSSTSLLFTFYQRVMIMSNSCFFFNSTFTITRGGFKHLFINKNNWGLERLRNISNIIELIGGGPGIKEKLAFYYTVHILYFWS